MGAVPAGEGSRSRGEGVRAHLAAAAPGGCSRESSPGGPGPGYELVLQPGLREGSSAAAPERSAPAPALQVWPASPLRRACPRLGCCAGLCVSPGPPESVRKRTGFAGAARPSSSLQHSAASAAQRRTWTPGVLMPRSFPGIPAASGIAGGLARACEVSRETQRDHARPSSSKNVVQLQFSPV